MEASLCMCHCHTLASVTGQAVRAPSAMTAEPGFPRRGAGASRLVLRQVPALSPSGGPSEGRR